MDVVKGLICLKSGSESCAQARKHVSEGIHPGFETQGRHHLKSKIGVSAAPQKGLMASKIFKKEEKKKGSESFTRWLTPLGQGGVRGMLY